MPMSGRTPVPRLARSSSLTLPSALLRIADASHQTQWFAGSDRGNRADSPWSRAPFQFGRMGLVIDLTPNQVLDMPVDQLGLLVLSDLLRTGEWNEYNYLLGVQRSGYQGRRR